MLSMSIEKLKRVMQRAKEKYPNDNQFPFTELERFIFLEIGTSAETVRRTVKVLKKLKWIIKDRNRITFGDRHEYDC